jgi:hypothetical protein
MPFATATPCGLLRAEPHAQPLLLLLIAFAFNPEDACRIVQSVKHTLQ